MCRYAITFALLGLSGISSALLAAPLPPGAMIPLYGTTVGANPNLAGAVVQDRLRPFAIRDNVGNVILRGNLQERVARSHNTEQLIYAPRLRNLVNPAGDAWVVSMTYTGFEGVPVNVEYRVDGLGNVGPNSVQRSLNGDSMRFRHDPNIILPPDSGRFLSIGTNAFESTHTGQISIYAQNDFGADVFSTTLSEVAVPAFAGDANLDGFFDTTDLVEMFTAGEYEDDIPDNSVWTEGDFNRDGDFTSYDLILALRTGRYQQPANAVSSEPRVQAVPEPTAAVSMLLACLGLAAPLRRYLHQR